MTEKKRRWLEGNNFICQPCAEDREWFIPEGHMPTWNVLECDECHEVKGVTQVRDYRK